MCGRYSITANGQQIALRFGVQVAGDWQAHYNAAPSQNLPVILNRDPQSVQWLRWGLVPHWAKDPNIGHKMINARAETLLEKPSFREPLRKRRCLVLADGYYEWQATPNGKQPMRFVLEDAQPFAMAGLWEEWNAGATPLATFTVITTSANPMAAAVHNRMPVILEPETERDWLNPAADLADLLPLLTPFAGEKMQVYPVSTRLNSPSNDDASLIARAAI